MKVYELMNQLKGTEATKEQIASWQYMNRICPVQLTAEELEIEKKFPEALSEIAEKLCSMNECGHECLDKFLESEVGP